MASVVVKTIWQSKEIHEAGDPPAGVESRAQLVPEAPGGVTSPAKGITKKKKAVSFHGVEPRMSHEPMHWCLNLKRSSACTNVSLLNLAAMEPDSSGTDSTTEDSGPLALPGPPASPTTPWAPEDPDITELLSGVNSGLVRAKDSITSLKEKTTRVNQHVQTLQSECSVLSENLERRRQEAEELEGYCSQLKENCRKVTRSVEDAEIKTNVLKQNSALLEEKLRYLQQQLQDETPRRQEAELQELEQKLEAGLSRHGLGPTTPIQGCSGPPGSPEEPPRPRGLPSNGWGMAIRAGEGPSLSEQELQKVSSGLEELRREVSSLAARWHQEEGAVQEALRLLGGLGGRLDGFLGQWERAQREQAQSARGLQELRGRADELCTMVERSAVSVASLRSELEALGPVKPILEELGRQLQNSRRGPDHVLNLDRPAQGPCPRCASQGQQLSTESLQQLLERALTPLVDEVKQKGLAPACPSCQRLHKKILPSPVSPAAPTLLSPGAGAPGLGQTRQGRGPELHPSAGPRRSRSGQEPTADGQDEAGVRTEAEGMGGGEKVATLDYMHLKMCSLHDQLSHLPLEGSTGAMGGGSTGGAPPKRGGPGSEQ
ncbi:testis-specific serine kinase substrate isoform X2 [Rattus norvegicus]|uniref:testis-specific serine kinase substrate isoform 2 n=1 Tax=Rattus norvegicus TaxID=10116 RepID=UPI0003D06FEC|nr:testis-specific serine kinase substrate isoform X2 [Rattus norvegicus]|eukprot:XP_006229077.1 PREDICTED: testis-specific serine kinase substrate isoform X2 [Rattus norvegicus]